MNISIIKKSIINICILSAFIFYIIFVNIVVLGINNYHLLISSIVILPVSILLSYLIIIFLSKRKLIINEYRFRNRLIVFFIDLILIFIFGITINLLREFFTGRVVFENDYIDSINESLKFQFTEFRSPIFSILFAYIPIQICNTPLFFSIYYIFIRSIILSVIISDKLICKNNLLFNLVLVLYYCFMPLSLHSELCILKDTPCSLFIVLSIYLIIKFSIEHKSNIYITLIPVSLDLSYFLRPNAILFVLPMLILLPFVINNIKKSIIIIIAFSIIVIFTNFILFSIIKIKPYNEGDKIKEIAGFPVSIILSVAKNNISYLNQNELELYKELSGNNEEYINIFNEKTGYESVKYVDSTMKTLPKYNYMKLASFAFDLLFREHNYSIRQAVLSTNSLFMKRNLTKKLLNSLMAKIYYLLQDYEICFEFIIIFLLIFGTIQINNKQDLYKVLLFIPMLIMTLGTSIAITSPAILRYFMPLQMSFPIYLSFCVLNKS